MRPDQLAENFGSRSPTLMATIAGNFFELSDLSAIRPAEAELPSDHAVITPGPQFGSVGTAHAICIIDGRLIGTIIKPCGRLNADETAGLVKEVTVAEIDFIKDDELQVNGPHNPLADLVAAVQCADKTGKKVIHAFNITDETDGMWRMLGHLAQNGAFRPMVCVNAVGIRGLRAVRDRSPLMPMGTVPDGVSFPARPISAFRSGAGKRTGGWPEPACQWIGQQVHRGRPDRRHLRPLGTEAGVPRWRANLRRDAGLFLGSYCLAV